MDKVHRLALNGFLISNKSRRGGCRLIRATTVRGVEFGIGMGMPRYASANGEKIDSPKPLAFHH